MSQKPNAGAQSRSASATRGAVNEVATKNAASQPETASTVQSSVKAGTVKEAAPAPAAAAPVAPWKPTVQASPVAETPNPVHSPPVETIAALTEAAPIPIEAPVLIEPRVAIPMPVPPTPVPAEARVVVETSKQIATATVETAAALTVEVIDLAAPIKPTKPTLTQGLKKMMKSTEELVAFSQANMEAFMKSGQIWSAGMQELTKQIATSAKASFEESVSTFKAMSTARSVKEALDLQSSFAKAALEKAMAESNKLTDASIKLTEETLAPITARVTNAVESFKTH